MDRLPTASLFFFWCIILFSSTQASAQITKGYWMVGGNAYWNSYNDIIATPTYEIKGSVNEIRLNGSIGYFFRDKFASGLRSQIWMIDGEFTNGAIQIQKEISVGPFVRYYFLKKDEQVNLLADISYLLGKNIDFSSQLGKHNILDIILGVELFINSSVGMEVLYGYKSIVSSIDNNPNINFNSLSVGSFMSIGFQYHLIKK